MVFGNVWPLSAAVNSTSSSSSVENGAAVSNHASAAVSSTNNNMPAAPMPVPVHHHHVEPAAAVPAAAVPVVAAPVQHPALAPEALLDAVNEGSVAQVHAILARDPSLANHRDGFGQTPLMWAAYKGRVDMVSCLLDCGARINECETRRARTALYLACEFDHAPVVALLLTRGANLTLAAQRGWTVLSRGYDGWTPLIIAGYNGCPAVLRCLLAPSSSSSSLPSSPSSSTSSSLLEGRDEKGATALWWAAVHNRPEAVRVLLEAGADFLQANDEGKTALDMARERSNVDCALLLESAERTYVMCRARKVQRETQAWALLLEEALAGMPKWLAGRVGGGRDVLPFALPQPQFDRKIAETQDGKQDGKEGGREGGRQERLVEVMTPSSSFADARQEEEEEEEEESGEEEEGRGREGKMLRECSSSFSSEASFYRSSSLSTLLPSYFHSSSSCSSPYSTHHHQPLEETSTTEEEEGGREGGKEAVLVPAGVAHYVKGKMRYEIFLALQDLLI